MIYIILLLKRDKNKDIGIQYETDDNDNINFNDYITPNHYLGIKKNNEISR